MLQADILPRAVSQVLVITARLQVQEQPWAQRTRGDGRYLLGTMSQGLVNSTSSFEQSRKLLWSLPTWSEAYLTNVPPTLLDHGRRHVPLQSHILLSQGCSPSTILRLLYSSVASATYKMGASSVPEKTGLDSPIQDSKVGAEAHGSLKTDDDTSDEQASVAEQHIFSDPFVTEHWRAIYEKAGYENRHIFDPTFTWSPEEERACAEDRPQNHGVGLDHVLCT